ncbi:MAG TPA: glycosyltransferase [Rhizomicrobium sp.]|nr:glycosyltransferase [Rhizomicrobium sp.]
MTALAFVPLIAWLYLLFGRGMFWLLRERDDDSIPTPRIVLPSVVAVVPARNEADVIARAVTSLLKQDYNGSFRIVLVDDGSSDGTAGIATRAALAGGRANGLEIISGTERPAGWTGKLWAMKQGLVHALGDTSPDYLLFTDADIAHTPDSVSRLVARAESRQFVLVSLMAKLTSESGTEKLLIPAFVFFFAMLFPFSWVEDPARKTAAAAGGCMLVRREVLEAAGGLEKIAGAIIDDCALARLLKPRGLIWLGLTKRVESLRPYGNIGEIGAMVARSAYAQLRYSPWLLGGTLVGMAIVYAAPVLLTLLAFGLPRIAGVAAWLLMTLLFQPMLRFYRLSPLWGLALPLIGALYALFTLQSAVQHWRGRGGMWKGRAQAMA